MEMVMGMGQNCKKWFETRKLEIQGEMIRKSGRNREHLSSTSGSQGALSWVSYRLTCTAEDFMALAISGWRSAWKRQRLETGKFFEK